MNDDKTDDLPATDQGDHPDPVWNADDPWAGVDDGLGPDPWEREPLGGLADDPWGMPPPASAETPPAAPATPDPRTATRRPARSRAARRPPRRRPPPRRARSPRSVAASYGRLALAALAVVAALAATLTVPRGDGGDEAGDRPANRAGVATTAEPPQRHRPKLALDLDARRVHANPHAGRRKGRAQRRRRSERSGRRPAPKRAAKPGRPPTRSPRRVSPPTPFGDAADGPLMDRFGLGWVTKGGRTSRPAPSTPRRHPTRR